MSGTVPGAAWGAALWRKPSFIVRRRGRMHWTTTTYKGVRRRVTRWERWQSMKYCDTLTWARDEAERLRVGLYDIGIFYRGRRLSRREIATAQLRPTPTETAPEGSDRAAPPKPAPTAKEDR